ncbi:MAG: 3-oxoadipate enol-lactonase [Chitinophagales bacterium]
MAEFIECNGHTIHYKYLDNKSVKNILFINSLGSDFRIWDAVLPSINAHGNILLYDKRGHGLSDSCPATIGLEDYASDALQLLQRLSISQCTVVGISVGGMIAQILASQYPGMVGKAVLCDTAQIIGNQEMWNARIAKIKAEGLRSISSDLMKRWFSPSFHASYPERVAGYKNMLERSDLEGYVQTCEAIRDTDTTEIAKKLKMPVLCIVGEGDLSTSPAEMRSLTELIPGAKLEIISGSGHIPCIDNHEKFARTVIEFIK